MSFFLFAIFLKTDTTYQVLGFEWVLNICSKTENP